MKRHLLKTFLIPATIVMIVTIAVGCHTPVGEPFDVGEAEQALGSGGGGGECGLPGPQTQQCDNLMSQSDGALPDPNEVYLPASLTNELPMDTRLQVIFNDTAAVGIPAAFNPAVVQRLRGNVFIMCYNLYCSLVKRGQHGLLVVDAGGHFGLEERKRLLGGLAQIGNWNIDVEAVAAQWPPQPLHVGSGGLPVTGMVATHPHTDHAGGMEFLRMLFPQAKLVMSRWMADELLVHQQPMSPSAGYSRNKRWFEEGANTGIVRCRHDFFRFEGKKVRMVTPLLSAHTNADSYLVFENEKVGMAVDFVAPNRLPYINTSLVTDVLGYIHFVRHLLGEFEAGNMEVASWGHYNVGYRRDVELGLDYLFDLKQAWPQAILGNGLGNFIFGYLDPMNPAPNAYPAFEQWFDDVPNRMCEGLPPCKYNGLRNFEGCKEHAERLNEKLFVHHLREDLDPFNPPTLQDLQALALEILPGLKEPIAPGTHIYNDDEYCVGLEGLLKRGRVHIN